MTPVDATGAAMVNAAGSAATTQPVRRSTVMSVGMASWGSSLVASTKSVATALTSCSAAEV